MTWLIQGRAGTDVKFAEKCLSIRIGFQESAKHTFHTFYMAQQLFKVSTIPRRTSSCRVFN